MPSLNSKTSAPSVVVAPAPPLVSATPVPYPRLRPVRNFAGPDEMPPKGVGAYGLVALAHLPTPGTRDRLLAVCRAFLASLPPQSSVPSTVPASELMVTFWPVAHPDRAGADCNPLIDEYHLLSGQDAIRDANVQGARLYGRGPYLIGWSPAESRYARDAVVLIFDLSAYESEASFLEMFQAWQTQIVERPELWKKGFSVDQVRLGLRDLLDRYGQGILQAIKGG